MPERRTPEGEAAAQVVLSTLGTNGLLTEAGEAASAVVAAQQAAWMNRLAAGLGRSDLETTARVLDRLSLRLAADGADDNDEEEGRNE